MLTKQFFWEKVKLLIDPPTFSFLLCKLYLNIENICLHNLKETYSYHEHFLVNILSNLKIN